MRSKHYVRTIALALSLALTLVLGGCTSQEPVGGVSAPTPTTAQAADNTEYEFVFTGASSDFEGGRTMNVSICGLRDEACSLELRVVEFPQILIEGHYVFVEGKGYKLYFEDASSAFVYTRFQPEDNTFSFKYTLDAGSLGSARIAFTCQDEAFAAEYDGEGLGRTPPTFTGTVGGVGSGTVTLVCGEDGTFTTSSTSKYTGSRSGTWDYDESADQYLFHFAPDTSYNLAFEGNEADGQGRYCGFNKVDDGSTSNERQFCYLTAADPVCFELPISKESAIPLNEPYKSGCTYDAETGRYDISVKDLPNLEELVSGLSRGNNPDDYKSLPDVCYYVMDDGSLNFLPECATAYDPATGDYSLTWSVCNGKYSLAQGVYNPEA